MKSFLQNAIRRLRKSRRTGAIIFPLLILAVFLTGWWLGHPGGTALAPTGNSSGDDSTIWTCSMHPTVRQPDFGLCPICSMDLIPTSADGMGGLRELSLSNQAASHLDLRVAPVVRQPFTKTVQLLGKVVPAETSLRTTTARFNGRLDDLLVDYTGATVLQGQPIAEIYSPELFVAQEELISAKRGLSQNKDRTRQAIYRAAREKLRLLEIPPEQIDAIEQQATPSDRITLRAPLDGVVMQLAKREGDYVKTGDPIFTLADLSVLWVQLEAYEDDLPWLAVGQDVTFTTTSLTGKVFQGRVSFIDPVLMNQRRIVQVRVVVDNPERALKPGMFVDASLVSLPAMAGAEVPLLVPSSAVLRTGNRAIVYRRIPADEGVSFEGREIVLGPRADDYFIVHSGLSEGDLVATRGAFKLDSELQVQAKLAMMLDGQSIGERPALEAPVTLLGAWQPILRALARAGKARMEPGAMASADFQKELLRAREILQTIEPKFLADDYAPIWNEARMQLENLFTEVRLEAENTSLASAWELLTQQLPEEAGFAGLPWQLPDLKSLPPSRLAELERAIESYLPLVDHLAHDRPGEALDKVPALLTTLNPLGTVARESIAALSQATGEDSLRSAIVVTTNALEEVIREGAADQLGELYLVHCPMVSRNEGANWLSREPVVENPYYGSSMFDCGDVTETLSLPLAEPTP